MTICGLRPPAPRRAVVVGVLGGIGLSLATYDSALSGWRHGELTAALPIALAVLTGVLKTTTA